MPPAALVASTQSWKTVLASAVDPEATPVNEPMTPTMIGAAPDTPLALPTEAEPAADEGEEDEELHPASARAARRNAVSPARIPVRRDRVIAALLFWPELAAVGRGAGRSYYLIVTSPLETELRSAQGTCQARKLGPCAERF